MRRTTGPAERLTVVLSLLMALAYVGGGIGLIASSQSFGFLPAPGPLRYAMAVLLIAYGVFRAYRAYQRSIERNELD